MSTQVHIRIDASTHPQISIVIANIKLHFVTNNSAKKAKQKKAVFTKKPLKKIEKPAGASTCTFVNQ